LSGQLVLSKYQARKYYARLLSGVEKLLIIAMPLLARCRFPFLLGCLALGGSASRAMADPTNFSRLKPNQVLTPGAPLQSPEKFNPDPGKLLLPDAPPATTNWSRKISINTNAPPSAPAQFNPDPGASLKQPGPAVSPLFPGEPQAPPLFVPPAPAAEQSLPRPEVRGGEIVYPPASRSNRFGLELLPDQQRLPRENALRNSRIERKFEIPDYVRGETLPTNTEAKPDRWRLGFVPWKRYTSGVAEQPYETPEPMLWHPYRQSRLKGDVPIWGQDIFLNLTASSETETEFRRVPTASGVSTAVAGAYEFYGQSEQISVQNNLAFSVELFKGETVFKPVEWALKLEPVFNINYLNARETGVVSPDPRGSIEVGARPPPGSGFVLSPGDVDMLLNGQIGPAQSFRGSQHTVRTRDFAALQQGFFDLHLRDLSDNYDFVALRGGLQPFNSDFRGFIFNDVNLGVRLFGNYDNNLWQYNLALFDMREKDSNSELNTFASRDQYVVVANVYRQDFLAHGYTAEWSFHANLDRGGRHYDENGNLARPAPLGTVEDHDVSAFYFGWSGDGHIGRFNISHALYEVVGPDSYNGLAGHAVDINAQMAAVELSYDHDWARYKASFFYASGDGNAGDRAATGFDTIVDNPNFTGGPFSYWTRQGFNLGGTMVNLKQRSSLVPDLRTSKTEGQANFVNPGALIFGLGAEFDLTPKLRAFLNANYIRMVETDTIKAALFTDKVDAEIGGDLSLGVQYRPLLTDNVIISIGFGALIPGQGFRDIYQTSTRPVPNFENTNLRGQVDDFLYSGLVAITLTY
jgi:hypothetical protein